MEPEKDILFINGPLDVLDHSASKATYGGKMGIDATTKIEEEINERPRKVLNIKSPSELKQKLAA